jgi:hypothetical protein
VAFLVNTPKLFDTPVFKRFRANPKCTKFSF